MIIVRSISAALMSMSLSLFGQAFDPQLKPVPDFSIFQRQPDTVTRPLINNEYPDLFMVVLPSFTEPYSIVMASAKDGTKSLEYSKYSKAKGKSLRFDRVQIKIPFALANSLSEAWESVIRNARYPSKPDPRLIVDEIDGETYIFYSHPSLFGQTRLPSCPIVGLGESLIKLATCRPADRDRLLDQCHELAIQISKAQAQIQ